MKTFWKKVKRKHILIDYENVHSQPFESLRDLHKSDFVYLLYSKNSQTMSFEGMEHLQACPAKIHYQPVFLTGENSLDFQLSSYVGYLIAYFPKDEFIIYANDKVYDCVVQFWQDKGVAIKRIGKEENDTKKLAEMSPKIQEIVKKYLPQGKNAVYQALTKEFGQEKGLVEYHKIKKSL